MKIGERIKEIRKSRGLSVEEVAEKIDVSVSTLYRYENSSISKVPIDVIEACIPTAEKYDVRIGKEIHAPWPIKPGNYVQPKKGMAAWKRPKSTAMRTMALPIGRRKMTPPMILTVKQSMASATDNRKRSNTLIIYSQDAISGNHNDIDQGRLKGRGVQSLNAGTGQVGGHERKNTV